MAAGQGGFDQLVDSFVDFSDYDTNNLTFQSPELTPSSSSNLSPPNTLKTEPPSTPSLFPTSQVFSGPSHQYDLHKQQTGIVPGALATTLSMNPPHGFYQEYLDFQEQQVLAGMDDELFDFNSPLQGTLDASALDLGFQTPPSDSGLYISTTINPNALSGHDDALSASSMPPPPSLTATNGRLYPGMHQQQAALARAQYQQKQQLLQRQRAQQAQAQAQAQQAKQAAQKSRAPQTSGTIAEQSVQNILNSMRTEVPHYEPIKTLPPMNFPKQKKSESEMDEDEKFLASAEGKKLDPQARRQLRNKVSARAFRGRRKEYITWLEARLTDRINDVGIMKAQNAALIDENSRLTNLTRMLLTSPQFKEMLGDLSANPAKLAQLQSSAGPTPSAVAVPQPRPIMPHMTDEERSQHLHQQFQQSCYAA
ncbi:hypothetical protein C8A05DRAFT_35559 [Staphylotrichum tortipilum]|uniref:BZIP domain-containing protein n=1 Tax=Staphylotrichum tortipilum TaxID=2831512 RepID=A0AAN6MHQ4_9PEZI|nr:hypothetical protein C8A05DRAFT_35559 [Staphylotrichum longicolle]